MYHRYYYKCSSSDCDFSLDKFCAELSTRLEHVLHHRHPLVQGWMHGRWVCCICKCVHPSLSPNMCYSCSTCDFAIDVNCAVEVGKKVIYHPCHPHLLVCAIPKFILCECSACGIRHEGIFYQCSTCVGFTIHKDCALLPKSLLIQERTKGVFYDPHPLTISYSFPREDQIAKHAPRCRVCKLSFYSTEDLWIYKCDRCMFYAHLHCVRKPPAGVRKTIKNFKDVDHPHLLHLPFPDETYSIPKHLFFQQTGSRMLITSLQHDSHQHPLILVHTQTSSSITSSLLLKCHNPMKKTRLLCNGCLRPIKSAMPFYMCDHQSCDFALHEWCTRLPQEIEEHPQHTLVRKYPNVLPHFFGVFNCAVCDLPCNGFAYSCVQCGYYVDVSCGFIPRVITHKAHPDHLLSIFGKGYPDDGCFMCLKPHSSEFVFRCKTCRVFIHPECAFLLPEAIRHKYDKHPMNLSYLPIQNHKSEYFCEICEHDLDPHKSFYHCHDCIQSVHTACAPLVLKSETYTQVKYPQSTYIFLNIKFGGNYNTKGHPHPLSFAQGIVSDGQCSMCGEGLQYKMIFKCLECKFAISYDCCKRLDDS